MYSIIDLSYGCCGRGSLTIILARQQYYIIRAAKIRDGVYETLSGGHEFFYEKHFKSLPSSIGMKMGICFSFVKCSKVNLNLKVPQSLVFYSMIWNYYRKLLQFLEKKFLFTI
jgi:hypothetical protein